MDEKGNGSVGEKLQGWGEGCQERETAGNVEGAVGEIRRGWRGKLGGAKRPVFGVARS